MLFFAVLSAGVIFSRRDTLAAEMMEFMHSNFLLLSLGPVLLALGARYKHVLFWAYDILRPVSKARFLREQAVQMVSFVGFYFILFILSLVVVPAALYHQEILGQASLWGYVMLCGNVALLAAASIALLNCYTQPWFVMGYGVLTGTLVLIYFYFVEHIPWPQLMVSNGMLGALNIFLAIMAYRAWRRKEY